MAERSANVIEIRGLVNRFGEQVLHDGLDLDIRRGEVIGVVGGSGTGKSVLMRTIVGLNPPAAGDIRVLGQLTRLEVRESDSDPTLAALRFALAQGPSGTSRPWTTGCSRRGRGWPSSWSRPGACPAGSSTAR